jgi:hypothetical protein
MQNDVYLHLFGTLCSQHVYVAILIGTQPFFNILYHRANSGYCLFQFVGRSIQLFGPIINFVGLVNAYTAIVAFTNF